MAAPQDGKRNVLITSALPYVNNIPHLGNIIGSVLSADVFARYCRARGYSTLYICGSDEYGTATETKAIDEGVTPQELCAKYWKIHHDIYQWFNISFDKFGRTSTQQQTDISQDIFLKLLKNGYLEEKTTVQPYCEKHESFLADRFVEGECSICHDPGARGDQCDKCGNVLDPLEPEENAEAGDADGDQKATGYLINPRCKLDGASPVKRRTNHIFLRLDALNGKVVEWFQKASKEGSWSANSQHITQAWIDKGLKPRSITRDLKWGTAVPYSGYDKKVMYVWFDACIGYVSITATHTENWEKWWKNPENVKLYQFIGKDNTVFHTLTFPASQLGTGDNWTQCHHMSTTEYLNYEGGKFSKSRGVGVFGNNAKDTGIKSDIWRFYLLSRRPETSDSEFKWKDFIDANNNDLLKNLGNFVNRVIKFVVAKYDSIVPDYTAHQNADTYLSAHADELNAILAAYTSHLEAVKLRAALMDAMHISALGNKLLQDNKLDNKLFTGSPDRCAAVVGSALSHIYLLANIIAPYLPDTYECIMRQLGLSESVSAAEEGGARGERDGERDAGAGAGAGAKAVIPDVWDPAAIKPGHRIGKPEYLFVQIAADKEEEWREAYGGEEVKLQKEEAKAKAAAKKAAKEKEKAKKAAKKLAAKVGAGAGGEGKGTEGGKGAQVRKKTTSGVGVEAPEKREMQDDGVEEVTQTLEKAEVRTS